jgi:hypothetical protein
LNKRQVEMAQKERQIWDLWIPDVAAQGISFARGRLDATEVLIVHAAPEKLTVEVHDDNGTLLAHSADLPRTANTPMARLRRQGNQVTREDIWPTEADFGSLVILAGGEVGILQHWENDPQEQEWRWKLEFYNHR